MPSRTAHPQPPAPFLELHAGGVHLVIQRVPYRLLAALSSLASASWWGCLGHRPVTAHLSAGQVRTCSRSRTETDPAGCGPRNDDDAAAVASRLRCAADTWPTGRARLPRRQTRAAR